MRTTRRSVLDTLDRRAILRLLGLTILSADATPRVTVRARPWT